MKSTNLSRLMYIVVFASLGLIFCVLLAGAFLYLGSEPRAQLQPTSTYTPFPTNTQVSVVLVPSQTSTEYSGGNSGSSGDRNKTIYLYINVYSEKSNLPIEKARIMVDGYVVLPETDKNGYIEVYLDYPESEQFFTFYVVADGYSTVTQRIETPYNKDIEYKADVYLPVEGQVPPPPPPLSETPTFAPLIIPTDTPTPPNLETPNPTQTLEAAFEAVNNQFKNLPSSSIAFNKPDQMKRGDVATIELILNPSMSEAALATQIIEQGDFVTSTSDPNLLLAPNGLGVSVETSKIEITPRMKAVLQSEDPEAFDIRERHDNAEQVVSSLNTTTWRWSVTAKKEGPQTLELVIYQLVKLDGKDFWHEVETYKAKIVVDVTPLDKIKSLDWKWIAGFMLALVGSVLGVLNYLNNRKKKAEEEKPVQKKKKKQT
jgi:hypothetical protein